MLLGLFVVFLLLGSEEAAGRKRCPALRDPVHGAVACFRGGSRVSCASGAPVGSVARFACRQQYRSSSEGRSPPECRPDGSWSSSAPRCIPDCGRSGSSASLVVRGREAPRGAFPWHVAIYYFVDGNHEYWCGGSLISETAVLTAAHCVWGIPADKLVLAFGKFHRDYAAVEKHSQKREAKRIEMPSSYQDVSGNYNGDIAVIFLREPVGLGQLSAPVCLDREQRLVDRQLGEGASGVVAGWGVTENGTLGDGLRAVRLPVVSDEKCIAAQERDFKKFVTFTAFCAGFGNGTGVCNGDSGGGLAFFDEATSRWYLQGLVSVSPRRKGTHLCDPNFYTVFTKIGPFSRWLEAVQREEVDSERPKTRPPYAERLGEGGGRNGSVFPHTSKMLELAGLPDAGRRRRSLGTALRGPRPPPPRRSPRQVFAHRLRIREKKKGKKVGVRPSSSPPAESVLEGATSPNPVIY